MEKSLEMRIDSQYYVDKDVSNETAEEMFKRAPVFLAKCKSALDKITEEKIREIRGEIKEK